MTPDLAPGDKVKVLFCDGVKAGAVTKVTKNTVVVDIPARGQFAFDHSSVLKVPAK